MESRSGRIPFAKTMLSKELAQKPTDEEEHGKNESDKRRRDGEQRQRPSESPGEKRGKRKAGEGGGWGPLCLIVTRDQCVK